MKAITFDGVGGPEVINVIDVAIPEVLPNEVLIKVMAAGINGPDIWQRKGLYPPPKGSSQYPGLEVSGIVEKVGKNAHKYQCGDEVIALVTEGGYAEYCVVDELTIMPKPKNLSFIEAAALPETFITVWLNLVQLAKFNAGKSVLIHGGTGGIGVAATQIARALGASKIITTVRSKKKVHESISIGADIAINVRDHDFEKVVLESTDYKGVDIILDIVAGDYVQKNINICAFNGKILQLGIIKGASKNIDISPLALKHLSIIGSTLRRRSPLEKNNIIKDMVGILWPKIESGNIKPHVFKTFPLCNAREAHQEIDNENHLGKIILITVNELYYE